MLPWTVSGAPGLAAHGPVDSSPGPNMDDGLDFVGADAEDHGEATELPASPGPNKVDGLDIVGAVAEDHGEAMEFLASPRSPLCFSARRQRFCRPHLGRRILHLTFPISVSWSPHRCFLNLK